jgi:hypothetical protein
LCLYHPAKSVSLRAESVAFTIPRNTVACRLVPIACCALSSNKKNLFPERSARFRSKHSNPRKSSSGKIDCIKFEGLKLGRAVVRGEVLLLRESGRFKSGEAAVLFSVRVSVFGIVGSLYGSRYTQRRQTSFFSSGCDRLSNRGHSTSGLIRIALDGLLTILERQGDVPDTYS